MASADATATTVALGVGSLRPSLPWLVPWQAVPAAPAPDFIHDKDGSPEELAGRPFGGDCVALRGSRSGRLAWTISL
jgi:hypothetical protein